MIRNCREVGISMISLSESQLRASLWANSRLSKHLNQKHLYTQKQCLTSDINLFCDLGKIHLTYLGQLYDLSDEKAELGVNEVTLFRLSNT